MYTKGTREHLNTRLWVGLGSSGWDKGSGGRGLGVSRHFLAKLPTWSWHYVQHVRVVMKIGCPGLQEVESK